MRRLAVQFVLAAAISVFTMCSNNNGIPVESNWELESIYFNGSTMTPPEDHAPTLAFLKDSKIAGETGCNRFFGDFTLAGENLKFENIGSTRMMCPQMAFENAFIGAINKTAQFTLAGDTMALKDNDGNIIALLKKIEPTSLEN